MFRCPYIKPIVTTRARHIYQQQTCEITLCWSSRTIDGRDSELHLRRSLTATGSYPLQHREQAKTERTEIMLAIGLIRFRLPHSHR